tara:strand:+ start:129 stop:434 length:306 start_codon:yes stop_codon:yes gene_type:complete
MKKLLGIVVLGLLWSTNSYARFRICSGGSSCDNLILPAALLSLGMSGFFLYVYYSSLKYEKKIHQEIKKNFDMSDFLKNNWSDLAFSLVMFFISMYLFSQS